MLTCQHQHLLELSTSLGVFMNLLKKLFSAVCIGAALMASSAAMAQNAKAPSGKVVINETQFGFIVGGSVGGGELTYEGKTYKFKIGGMSLGANIGVSKVSASGEVYDLKDISKFPGTYVSLDGTVALGGGVGGMKLKNEHGVIMRLQATTQGLQLNASSSGVTVKLE